MNPPWYSAWNRNEFLLARNRQYQAAMADYAAEGSPKNQIIVQPPEDEIICDDCNAEIITQVVHLVRQGSWAVCEECLPPLEGEK
jgi:hypothetical protein